MYRGLVWIYRLPLEKRFEQVYPTVKILWCSPLCCYQPIAIAMISLGVRRTLVLGCDHTSFECIWAVYHTYGIIRHMQSLYWSVLESIKWIHNGSASLGWNLVWVVTSRSHQVCFPSQHICQYPFWVSVVVDMCCDIAGLIGSFEHWLWDTTRKRDALIFCCFPLFWESFNCYSFRTTGPIQVGFSAKCT